MVRRLLQGDPFHRQYCIGVFDSGLGGLTVVKALKEILPNERILYFGDTARLPYGVKSRDLIIQYSIQKIDFLQHKQFF